MEKQGYQSGVITKKRIIEASTELFFQHGYDKTTFKMISEATGSLIGAISYHYKTKADLYHAVYYEYQKQIGWECSNFLSQKHIYNTYFACLLSDYRSYHRIFNDEKFRRFMAPSVQICTYSAEDYFTVFLSHFRSLVEFNESDPYWLMNISACKEASDGLIRMLTQDFKRFNEQYTAKEFFEYEIRLIPRYFKTDVNKLEQVLDDFWRIPFPEEWFQY